MVSAEDFGRMSIQDRESQKFCLDMSGNVCVRVKNIGGDRLPQTWNASGGTLPPVTPLTEDRWVISVGGTLPAPVGPVIPGDYIIYNGLTDTWTVIHSTSYPQFGTVDPIGVYVPRYIGDSYTNTAVPSFWRAYGLTTNDRSL